MRVLIDTNVLISAAMSSTGKPYQAFLKAVLHPNTGLVCDQNVDELRRVFNRKFPDKIPLLERFLSLALSVKLFQPHLHQLPKKRLFVM